MNKTELINAITDRSDGHVSRNQVSAVITNLVEEVTEQLKAGERVSIPGFIAFRVKDKPATKARKGRNPFTGEEMTFKAKPASKVPKISALKNLKDAVATSKAKAPAKKAKKAAKKKKRAA